MSYEIVYDRLFIKHAAGFTPLILSGSNNCTEIMWNGRERRERDWGLIWGKPAMSEEEMLERVKVSCEKPYHQHFKRNGKWVDDAGFYRFVRNGIKNAMTIEEVLSHSPLSLLQCSVLIYTEDGSYSPPKVELKETIRTSDALCGWIDTAKRRIKECAENERPYYHMGFLAREPLKLPRQSDISGPVVACYGKGYVIKAGPNEIAHSLSPQNVLVFDSTYDAMQQIPARFHAKLRFCHAESILAKQSWRHCIQVCDGSNAGTYVHHLTRSRLHMTSQIENAKRFSSEKEARKYIERTLQRRLSNLTFDVVSCPRTMNEALSCA